ncbi:MAG: NUDIX domain-containing protein, partial [Clostridia bacterium]|nr:NUDIX domain-containing protein [Clostridia bacterium]
MSGSLKKNILRQRPRLLYAGINNTGAGWINSKSSAENAELIFISSGRGKIEAGETDEEAAYRELFEETGISSDDIILTHI